MPSRPVVAILAVLAFGLSAGCASSSSSTTPDGKERAPLVAIEQVGSVMELGVQPRGGIPMQYRLTIENPFDHEVELTSVEVETVGEAGGYSMNRVRHPFSQKIAPGEKRQLNFRAWIRVLTEGELRSVDHPVLLRGVALFQSPSGGVMSRNFFARANETSKTKSEKAIRTTKE